jgi:hypothetical protein
VAAHLRDQFHARIAGGDPVEGQRPAASGCAGGRGNQAIGKISLAGLLQNSARGTTCKIAFLANLSALFQSIKLKIYTPWGCRGGRGLPVCAGWSTLPLYYVALLFGNDL